MNICFAIPYHVPIFRCIELSLRGSGSVMNGKPQCVCLFKFYSHQLMHFFIQLCISLLSYIKIT